MTRNLRERVEVLVPISDPALRDRLEEVLRLYWADNAKAHAMTSGGVYVRLKPQAGEAGFEAQAFLMAHPEGRARTSENGPDPEPAPEITLASVT